MKFIKNHLPVKPKGASKQIDCLWDIVTNHVWTRLLWQDIKINFVLVLLSIILALVAILVVK